MVTGSPGPLACVRLAPGEELVAALCGQLDRLGAGGAAVVSAIGSLRRVVYAIATTDPDGEPRYSDPITHTGVAEIAALQGHIGRRDDGTADGHFHGAFVLGDGTVVAGHLINADVLVTVEATLLAAADIAWQRSTLTLDGMTRAFPVLDPRRTR